MTLALRYAVRSDVGLLREGNEDSAYAGPRLLAIADGMGGHAAGEVASAVAIGALADLDNDQVVRGDMLEALAGAVSTANHTLHEMSAADPSVEGMGTTLTAMLWAAGRIGLCHIGDSRGYLLRDGELYQITRDHTLVQSLVDEGRLSPDEAATHPQRSLILRALDGRNDAEPDLSLREAQAGDRYLLCSDGLSDVVSAETLHQTLTTVKDPDEAVIQLVELANRGGGPDNITCIVADVVDDVVTPVADEVPVVAGAALNSNGRGLPGLQLTPPDTPAGRATALTQTAPQPVVGAADGYPATSLGPDPRASRTGPVRHRRRWPIVTSVLVVLGIVIIGGAYAAWRYSQSQYYVAASNGEVVIYKGISQKVAGISLSSIHTHTGIPVAGVPALDQSRITSTIPSSSLSDAQQTVSAVRAEWQSCRQAYGALQAWQQETAHWPKPAKGAKPKPMPPKPAVPGNCPPESSTGATAPASPSPAPSGGASKAPAAAPSAPAAAAAAAGVAL
jgi:PPM family protein phosphatase